MDILSNRVKAALSVAASGTIGWLAWLTNTTFIPVSLLFPPLAFVQSTRTRATFVSLSYYGISSLPLLQISTKYFGSGHDLTGIMPWVTASGILAAPWIIFWDRGRNRIWWRLPVALLVITVPPIGIIGWASPLMAAGSIFPGFGWFGVLLVTLGMIALGQRYLRLTAALVVLSLIANISYKGPRPIESTWLGADTQFSNSHDSNDPNAEFSIAEKIQRIALATDYRVIVFPEMVLRQWSESTDLFWQSTLDALRERGSTIVIGAALASPASVNEYRNAAVIRGADHASTFEQRIPVPLAMSKPWGGENRFPVRLAGPSTIQLAGERAAILICYEQLLPWIYFSALWDQPTVIIGLSNAYWTKETMIPKNQKASLEAWGRLFGKPLITATNY